MKLNKVLKASIWYTFSNFLLKGMGFLTTPIFARILTQDEYGIVNNFNAWLAIIAILGSFSLSASLVRARFDYKEELNSFIKTNLLFGSFITFMFVGVFFFFEEFWTSLFVLDRKYILLMFAVVFVNPAYDMFLQKEQFQYKYKTVTVLSSLLAISNIVVSLILIGIMDDNLQARLLGSQAPTIIVGLVLYIYFLKKGSEIRLEYLRYSIPMCIPYMIHLLSGTLLNSSDRTMITKMCGTTDTALYSMAYNVALIVSVIWSSMNNAFSPWLGEKLQGRNYNAIKKYAYGYIAIFFTFVIGVMLVTPEILFILGGTRYLQAKYVIPPVMVGYVFLFLYSLYVNIEQFEKKTLGMAICTIVCALINIGLNWLFIPRVGYIAAAYTTLVGYLLMLVIHYFLVKHIELHICYDNKYILVISVLSLLISMICTILYENMIARYIVLLAYIIILVIIIRKYKDRLKGFIKLK